MRFIVELFTAVVMLAGVAVGIYSFTFPARYSWMPNNAVSIAMIYPQATFYGVISIALFAFAAVLVLSLRQNPVN